MFQITEDAFLSLEKSFEGQKTRRTDDHKFIEKEKVRHKATEKNTTFFI